MEEVITATFETHYDTRSSEVFRFALLEVSDRSLAEDITSETFLRFWQRYKDGHGLDNPRAMLYSIAYGIIVDQYRQKDARKEVPLDSVDVSLFSYDERFAEKLDEKEELGDILKRVRSLRDDYRDLIMMHYVQDLSICEIAEILEKQENAVPAQLHEALNALRTTITL